MERTIGLLAAQPLLVSPRRKFWFIFKVLAVIFLVWFAEPYTQALLIPTEEVITLATIFLSASIVFSVGRFFIVTAYRKRVNIAVGEQDNFIIGIDALSSLCVVLITLGSFFPVFGIPFTNFLTSLSLFSVASAWLFKEYISNFIDSYRLMFSRDFLIGDYIKLNDNTKGIITDITFRATKLRTDEGDVLFVPNSTLMNTEVTNYSKVKFKRIIVPFTVATSQIADIPKFEGHIRRYLIEAFPELIREQKTFLRIKDIQHEVTSCAFEVAIDQYSFSIENDIHKATYAAVLSFSSTPTHD